MNGELLTTREAERWNQLINSCVSHDIYHLAEYNRHAEEQGEGKALLFWYREGDLQIGFPMLIRPINDIAGLEGSDKFDATSVYGYPGPVTNSDNGFRPHWATVARFQTALIDALRSLNVIAIFSRLNPLLDNSWPLEGIGKVLTLGNTVAIGLGKENAQQLKAMTKGHRYDIRKARRNGVVVLEDIGFKRIDSFVDIYHETMSRARAPGYYFFDRTYFLRLKELLKKKVRLYFAERDSDIVSASLFFFHNGIIQYHLSGTPTDCLKYSGAKVILDDVRVRGTADSYSWLHLGGGIGSKKDSLYRFKAGFSKELHPFQVFRLIIDQESYFAAIKARARHLGCSPESLRNRAFFPNYRPV